MNKTAGEALDALLEGVWQMYQSSGHLADDIVGEIQSRSWRTGRPLSKDEVRDALAVTVQKMHRQQGYDPTKEHR